MNNQALVDLIIAYLVFIYEIYNGGGFTGARWAVEEEIGEAIACNDIIENDFIQRIQDDGVKCGGAIFFHPGNGCMIS
jgi:hypothetical protein